MGVFWRITWTRQLATSQRNRRQMMGGKRFLPKLEDRWVPADFPVTNINNTGTGSLRAAIIAVNGSNANVNIITFQDGLSGNIVLTTALDPISKEVSIRATTIVIRGLTISGGNPDGPGGGISYSGPQLVLVNDRVMNNRGTQGGGVYLSWSGRKYQ